MNKHKKIVLVLAFSFPVLAYGAPTDKPTTPHANASYAALRSVAQQAVLHSPEVTSKWHNLKAASEEIGVASGAFLPRVDVSVGSGSERLKQPPGQSTTSFSRTNTTVSLNQILFDGFATRNEVRRLDKARLVRYYELLEASESVALEASKAYLDVLRYRMLLALAEDNYVQHKATYEQILRKTQSGVGRRVDLEQAGSRLALAEVNLTTESANLHDVVARYQRLVGEMPPNVIYPPAQASTAYPKLPKDAMGVLYKKNPTLLAAMENVESAEYGVYNKRAAYSPKVDLRLRSDRTNNYQGTDEQRTDNVAEVVLTWNLFNGGSDRSRERQFVEQKNVAVDLREKACRDTRQTLLIAHNDVVRLGEQASYLALQVALLEKTRDAYRDQFNVGQRTLLDLLDTENELLSARRTAINADMDLTLAYFRTYAGMGTLLEFLGLQRLDAETPANDELADFDASQLCPPEETGKWSPDRASLDARAMALVDQGPVAPGLSGLPSGPAMEMAVQPQFKGEEAEIAKAVMGWKEAWQGRVFDTYVGFYAPSFTPDGGLNMEDWGQLRAGRIKPRSTISIDIQDLQIRMDGAERATVNFRQTYNSSEYSDVIKKTLEMIKVKGRWLINRESSVPCAGNTVGGCQ